mmetsp:Transcript_67800/g.109229  ORF Transcript_67800/g.109229 Transcript_67800/m.109229 type:complete len:218 (-) Transcript_67800:7-660(-)
MHEDNGAVLLKTVNLVVIDLHLPKLLAQGDALLLLPEVAEILALVHYGSASNGHLELLLRGGGPGDGMPLTCGPGHVSVGAAKELWELGRFQKVLRARNRKVNRVCQCLACRRTAGHGRRGGHQQRACGAGGQKAIGGAASSRRGGAEARLGDLRAAHAAGAEATLGARSHKRRGAGEAQAHAHPQHSCGLRHGVGASYLQDLSSGSSPTHLLWCKA